MALKLEKRIAFAFPDFRMDKFAAVMSMISASSLLHTLRLASITSKYTMIAILYG
jgi:hypothetical protein|tara:strand:- start:194 stop:358 length:165 start_codon:yes stop_codon:yes gene_type:complete